MIFNNNGRITDLEKHVGESIKKQLTRYDLNKNRELSNDELRALGAKFLDNGGNEVD